MSVDDEMALSRRWNMFFFVLRKALSPNVLLQFFAVPKCVLCHVPRHPPAHHDFIRRKRKNSEVGNARKVNGIFEYDKPAGLNLLDKMRGSLCGLVKNRFLDRLTASQTFQVSQETCHVSAL